MTHQDSDKDEFRTWDTRYNSYLIVMYRLQGAVPTVAN